MTGMNHLKVSFEQNFLGIAGSFRTIELIVALSSLGYPSFNLPSSLKPLTPKVLQGQHQALMWTGLFLSMFHLFCNFSCSSSWQN